jgi:hypothetical protein
LIKSQPKVSRVLVVTLETILLSRKVFKNFHSPEISEQVMIHKTDKMRRGNQVNQFNRKSTPSEKKKGQKIHDEHGGIKPPETSIQEISWRCWESNPD